MDSLYCHSLCCWSWEVSRAIGQSTIWCLNPRSWKDLTKMVLPKFFGSVTNRAPVLVAIALIEDGMSPLDSVELIRERRRGAINSKQLRYLETYKREQQAGGCKICWLYGCIRKEVQLDLPELRQLYQQQQRHETEMKEDDATIVSSGRTPYRRVRFASTSTANTLVESEISNRIKAEHYKLLYGSPFILSGLQTTNPSAEPDPHMHPVASMLVHTSLHFFFPPPIVHFFTQLLYTRKIPS